LISSYTFGIYPRSEELIEATRKNTENLYKPSIALIRQSLLRAFDQYDIAGY